MRSSDMMDVVGIPVLTFAAASLGVAAACTSLLAARLLDDRRLSWFGAALLLVGVIVLPVSASSTASAPSGPVHPTLHAVGMAIVLLVLVHVVLRELGAVRSEHDTQQEELGRVTSDLERATALAAERDHELRNGLAGLAGAAHLLRTRGGDGDTDRLRLALLAELGRLRLMLESPLALQMAGTDEEMTAEHGEPDHHLVAPLLERLVDLRVELPIVLRAAPGLRAATSPSVTSHIVMNLLANCARHAPGSTVTVCGRPGDGDTVVVEVRDTGPGLPDAELRRAFDRGVHDESAGGSGLGLYISRRMAEQSGGSLELRTVQNPGGCLAVLTLPSARQNRF